MQNKEGGYFLDIKKFLGRNNILRYLYNHTDFYENLFEKNHNKMSPTKRNFLSDSLHELFLWSPLDSLSYHSL